MNEKVSTVLNDPTKKQKEKEPEKPSNTPNNKDENQKKPEAEVREDKLSENN